MNKSKYLLKGLYAITQAEPIDAEALTNQVAAAIAGGARVVQYRGKQADRSARYAAARALLDLCRRHGIPLLVNDDVALAQAVGADGVHLGQTDCPLATARAQLGPNALIGISCHNDLELARQAAAGGADYVAFGRFFGSSTKPQAPPATIETLRRAHRALDLPIVAIGGITPHNGAPLVAAGADMLAVVHGIFGQPDIRAAAAAYAALFSTAASSQ